MQVNSLVETVLDFEPLRRIWGLAYPKKGDILTVLSIEKFTSMCNCTDCLEVRSLIKDKNIVFLRFNELPHLPALASASICNGNVVKPNFLEIQPPMDIVEEIGEPFIKVKEYA